jgi:arginine exporter protein ArgO
VSGDLASRAAFVVGAFLASLSWQEVLALAGAMLHGRLTPRSQRITAIVSSFIILALAARIALG